MLFVTGPHAAGKTFFAEYLQRGQSFGYIDLGPTLKDFWKQNNTENLSFGEFIQKGEAEYGANFTDDLLVAAINNKLTELHKEGKDLLIVGSRSANGIIYLRESIGANNGATTGVVYIDAPEEILHKRYCAREGKVLAIDDFKLILEKDKAMGLEQIRDIANYFIVNDGEIGHFESNIEKLIFDEMAYPRRVNKERS